MNRPKTRIEKFQDGLLIFCWVGLLSMILFLIYLFATVR